MNRYFGAFPQRICLKHSGQKVFFSINSQLPGGPPHKGNWLRSAIFIGVGERSAAHRCFVSPNLRRAGGAGTLGAPSGPAGPPGSAFGSGTGASRADPGGRPTIGFVPSGEFARCKPVLQRRRSGIPLELGSFFIKLSAISNQPSA